MPVEEFPLYIHTSVYWWWLKVLRVGTEVARSWFLPQPEIDGVAENLQLQHVCQQFQCIAVCV